MRQRKTYSDLISFPTFEERFEYLRLYQKIGDCTFGYERYLNQDFYTSSPWLAAREFVIARDGGYDLGIIGEEIRGIIIVHHINPIQPNEIHDIDYLTNPEFLISVRSPTHKKIHFLPKGQYLDVNFTSRYPNDMCPWKR